MTRKEQIEKAAMKDQCAMLTMFPDAFKRGAEWADQNPTIESQWGKTYIALCKQGAEIEMKLAIAVEALRKIEAPDKEPPRADLSDWLNAWRNTTKIMARQALEKIEGEK